MEPQKLKLKDEGAYGCVFLDGMTASSKQDKIDYVVKIQKRKTTSNNEENIGAIVRKIRNYKSYFAPVEKTTTVKLSSTDSNEIAKCGFINEEKKAFLSNKIRYVGKDTLAKYINSLSSNETNASTFFNKILECFIHLCEGLTKLEKENIIHLDLKENNIMIEEKTKVPIIIDFGLSKQVNTELDPEETFFTYGPDYGPWCYDICFLTYLVNELGTDWKKVNIETVQIEKTVNDFLKENSGVNTFLSAQEKEQLKTNLLREMEQYKNKTGIFVYESILKKSKNWDLYSISVIFLYLLLLINSEKIENNEIIKSFKGMLKNMLIQTQEKPSTKEILQKVYEKFASTNKQLVNKMTDGYKKEFTPKKFQQRSQQLAHTVVKESETDDKLKGKMKEK